jgi:hypothetical protein
MYSRNIDQILKLLVVIILFASTSAANPDYIINSADWKDTVSASTYYEGEKFLVTNPGEAEQAETRAGPDTELINSDDPGFQGLATRLNTSPTEFSYKDVYSKSDLDRIYIVNPHFSSEALTVLPAAVREDTAMTFYIEGEINKIPESTEKVFVGSFPGSPWNSFENSRHISGSLESLNRKFVRNYKSDTVILTDTSTPGYQTLLTGDPVLLTGGIEKDAEILEETGTEILKVIGSENTGYAQRLNDETSQDLRIALKVGRAVAGGSNAEIYSIKSFEPDSRLTQLSVEDTVYDQSTGAVKVDIVNKQENDVRVKINEIVLEGGNKTVIETEVGFYLEAGENATLFQETKKGLVPTDTVLAGTLNGREWSNNTETKISEVEMEQFEAEISGDNLYLSRSADSVFVSDGSNIYSLEETGSGYALPAQLDQESVQKVTLVSDNQVYSVEVGQSDRFMYLTVLSAAVIVLFLVVVVYSEREAIELYLEEFLS